MSGIAELPLHSGRVPAWMLRYMRRLGQAIVGAIIDLKGPDGLLNGLSDPFWFQAFNNVIGMDWDSSGSTTVVMWVLKEVSLENPELGFAVLGGKGECMKKIPEEVGTVERRLDVDAGRILALSKVSARADSAFLQDGYKLYLHSIVVSESGRMLVIQQGMNEATGLARRYHVDKLSIEEPHSGIAGIFGEALNATARESREARKVYLDILGEGGKHFERMLAESVRMLRGDRTITSFIKSGSEGSRGQDVKAALKLYRPVKPSRSLIEAVERLGENTPRTDLELAMAPGVGPGLVRALALISHLIYRIPTSTRDPVTHPMNPYVYSYAVGGKDRVPYPFNPKVALKAAMTLEEAIKQARLGRKEKLQAISRLKNIIERLEAHEGEQS
uniref:DUF763 domain-containing protein n=1 Tax=Fervidicoccus fontis TaxID=683846 RepID=A0A7J3ZKE7_9CREN